MLISRGTTAQIHESYQARARKELGPSDFDAAYDAGLQIGFENAIAFALGAPAAPREAVRASTDGSRAPRLTARELEVARLVARGLSNKQIAAALVISQRTAEGHVEHVLTKLGFTSRVQIAAWVTQRDATPPQPT